MKLDPCRAASASGRSNPCVSEMTPMVVMVYVSERNDFWAKDHAFGRCGVPLRSLRNLAHFAVKSFNREDRKATAAEVAKKQGLKCLFCRHHWQNQRRRMIRVMQHGIRRGHELVW